MSTPDLRYMLIAAFNEYLRRHPGQEPAHLAELLDLLETGVGQASTPDLPDWNDPDDAERRAIVGAPHHGATPPAREMTAREWAEEAIEPFFDKETEYQDAREELLSHVEAAIEEATSAATTRAEAAGRRLAEAEKVIAIAEAHFKASSNAGLNRNFWAAHDALTTYRTGGDQHGG